MDEPNQTYIQRQCRKRWEFSKKLAVADVVIYCVLMAALVVTMMFKNTASQLCVNAMTVISTVYTSLRLGYSAKATIENFQKIKNDLANCSCESSQDETIYFDDSDELG